MNVHDSVILEDSLPPKEKDPGSFTIPCYINNICFEKALADLGASSSVMPHTTFINLGLDELTPTKLIIELADKTIKRLKGIAENVLIDNEPLEVRRNQVEDLGLTIEDGKVIDEPMIKETKTRNDDDEIIIENMDAYRDQGMGDVIVGKPFCREICVKAKRFDGIITIYNGNDSVTYQMTCLHLRFIYLSNKQCNKMRPLLKISECDQLSGISHPYQKLKGFYKRSLELGTRIHKGCEDERMAHTGTHEHS
ncbi:UBN2 domain-containing protein [Tanacetum coccineum]